MKVIRWVENKDGSETVYVPAKYVALFHSIIEAGETDIFESEPERFEDVPNPLFEHEYR